MTIRQLAITNQGPTLYEFSTVLDTVRYYLQFRYNKRNDKWYVTIKDASRTTILSNLACCTNAFLLTKRYSIESLIPFGEILIADLNDLGRDPSYENFGNEVTACYVSVVS